VKKIQNKDLTTETTILERFISGAIAGFLSQTVIYPLDVNTLLTLSLNFCSLNLGLKSTTMFKKNRRIFQLVRCRETYLPI
jgi:hypothetical protein